MKIYCDLEASFFSSFYIDFTLIRTTVRIKYSGAMYQIDNIQRRIHGLNQSKYPYEDKIHSDDRVNYKTVYSAEGIKMGKVEAAFSDSFIVKLENEENSMEIKYEIPRLEISSLTDDRITLKLKLNEIEEKYETSSIKKSPK